MAQTIDMDAIRKLPVSERLRLLDLIWGTLVDDDADIPIDPEVMAEIRRRSEWAKANSDKLISHEDMMARLRSLT